jgi:hypothetical protein
MEKIILSSAIIMRFGQRYNKNHKKPQAFGGLRLTVYFCRRLPAVFVGYAEFLAGVTTAGTKDAAAVGGSHAGTETVLVHTLAAGRLKCSLHDISFLYFFA